MLDLKKIFDKSSVRILLVANLDITLIVTAFSIWYENTPILRTLFLASITVYSIGTISYFFIRSIDMLIEKMTLKFSLLIISFYISTFLGEIVSHSIYSLLLGSWLPIDYGRGFFFNMFLNSVFSFTMVYVFALRDRNEEQKIIEMELYKAHTQAELKALQAKTNPHFFFNTLNSITSLVEIDPKGAISMIHKLAKLFRYNLMTDDIKTVDIEKEIEIMKSYLEIEKVRLGDRLNYHFDVSPDSFNFKVPVFIMQPLIENCIKHGINKSVKGGTIEIIIKKIKESLMIIIKDNCQGFESQEKIVKGTGLSLVEKRLALSYKNYKFDILHDNGAVFIITIENYL